MNLDQYRLKRAALNVLRVDGDLNSLWVLKGELDVRFPAFLKWLDESGLALYLGKRLSENGQAGESLLGTALQERLEANRTRTASMLSEFKRVNTGLQRVGAIYAVVKGLTLAKEFCQDVYLRHQSDLDLLVVPESVRTVQAELVSLGYTVESVEASGEVGLAIRSEHVPSSADYLYSVPRNWHVEIHPAFYEAIRGTSLKVGEDWAEHIDTRELEGAAYPSLSLEYRFLLQVLHVFRHVGSWLRISWLYEIAYFIEAFRDDTDIWDDICRLTANDRKVQNACGVACRLVNEAFGTRFPGIIEKNWVEPLPIRHARWIERHGALWMLSDFGSAEKSGFLLQRDFADSNWSWWKYRAGRYRAFLGSLLHPRQRSGPSMLRERLGKQMNYMWATACWKLESRSQFRREKQTRECIPSISNEVKF